jgi:phasin family protein
MLNEGVIEMNDYMNNPMMDMFKKAMENPMSMWSQDNMAKVTESMQNQDMSKVFNPSSWMSMSGKMMENMPWANALKQNNAMDFSANMKNVEAFADMHKLSLESAQAMLRRQAEVIQKHSTDLYKLMQNMVSSPSPEAAMSMQSEYMQSAFEALVADFKELAEMYSKANLETFEAASCRVSDHMNKMRNAGCAAGAKCNEESHNHSHDKVETKKTKK